MRLPLLLLATFLSGVFGMSKWTYDQSSGRLEKDGVFKGTGYSGQSLSTVVSRKQTSENVLYCVWAFSSEYSNGIRAGDDKNKPESEGIRSKGPIPRGDWVMSRIVASGHHLGPQVVYLDPVGHTAHGRTAFRVHGDSRAHPGEASEGCIVIGPAGRRMMRVGDTLKVKE